MAPPNDDTDQRPQRQPSPPPTSHSQFQLLRQRRFLPFFIVQCLGAFNDNVYRQAIIGLLFWLGVPPEQRTLYANLAPALFILPYFLFSAIAGQLAERLEKSRLIRITTTMEIAVMSLAAFGFLDQRMGILLFALFLTGVQSTLFGPVKYSILPAVLRRDELTGGNGLVEMGTSVSVLSGMVFGGLIFQLAGRHGPIAAATAIVALAILGNRVSRWIPPVAAGAPGLKVHCNPVPESLAVLRLARKQLAVRHAILGVSWFWFVGTMLTAQLPAYAETHLGGCQELYVFALALFSVGTGLGSLLCEKLSGRTVEIGLVPLGAAGISLFLLDLSFASSIASAAGKLDVAGFIRAAGSARIMLDLAGIGLFSGIFVVPLFALIQSRAPADELSRVIAATNIQNALFIVVAAALGAIAQRFLGWTIQQLFLALAVANTLVALWIFSIVPEFAMRFVAWLLVNGLYRLRTRRVDDQIPENGPALLVCNHVSYMDALILGAAIKRPVRFVMDHKIFDIPLLRWLFRSAKAIPIAGAREKPQLMQQAFAQIDAALAEGELVCIFPEGRLTRDGDIAAFKPGLEHILARRPVPVVPLALRGMWASMWSRRDSRLGRMRVPRRFRARIEVVAGGTLDGADVDARQLQTQVRQLRGDAA